MGDATIEEVVEMLKVEWESPPVPTISHYTSRPVNITPTKWSGFAYRIPIHPRNFLLSDYEF
jgi:hypothetical protein